MEHTRATWRSYDPDLWLEDIHGDRPLKPHERAARDLGALAFDMVRSEWHKTREASPDAHVWRWIWRTHDGGAYYTAKCDAARAERKAMAAQMMREVRRAARECAAADSDFAICADGSAHLKRVFEYYGGEHE